MTVIANLTDTELEMERLHWETLIKSNCCFGASLAAAYEFYKKCKLEQDKRKHNNELQKAIAHLDRLDKEKEMETAERIKMIYEEILDELQRALVIFPSFHSGHEGYAIIKEELDELWRVVQLKQSTPGRATDMYNEAKQVAAMAIRFMLDMPGFKN